ncbi:MAG: hypothetical protein LBS01_09890 [Prevotellaceae bacterium]|jgi:hypothetical protein|nr:hypothetical protein [Prevotellaceae bacterium]
MVKKIYPVEFEIFDKDGYFLISDNLKKNKFDKKKNKVINSGNGCRCTDVVKNSEKPAR